ncbi:protein naked cuticle homolog 1-like [Polyodon spathula]|uniref:protein naked cuticle homolog 1-like n=1 Tax=Polyodon spathula TaxID=7913 RepID=UPI001B7E9FE7|nr:protein naked cuticle homolog 1-like [Polyodon spathula]
MGKLPSKHAAFCKPRESPEGDSFVVNACLARKGIEDWIAQQKYYCSSAHQHSSCHHKSACRTSKVSSRSSLKRPLWPWKSSLNHVNQELSESKQQGDPAGEACLETLGDEHYHLEVALPPEKTASCCNDEKKLGKESHVHSGSSKQLKLEELECDVSVEEDNRQEWTFTLYDFDNNGKVTREDITSLLHTIYEVVDASVNHSPSTNKTLRVKLTVAPDSIHKRKNTPQNHADTTRSRQRTESKCTEEPESSDKKSRAPLMRHHSDHAQQNGCYRHCVNENLERRNHYLDLAGIENYTSTFGPGSNPEPTKPEHQSRVVNQTRSRSHEPENTPPPSSSHPWRSQVLDPASCTKGLELQQRSQDSGRRLLRSPKSKYAVVAPSHPDGRAVRNKDSTCQSAPPPAPSHPACVGHNLPHLPAPQPTHKRHKQRAKEAAQPYKSFQPVAAGEGAPACHGVV